MLDYATPPPKPKQHLFVRIVLTIEGLLIGLVLIDWVLWIVPLHRWIWIVLVLPILVLSVACLVVAWQRGRLFP
jgi:hypothetical protein